MDFEWFCAVFYPDSKLKCNFFALAAKNPTQSAHILHLHKKFIKSTPKCNNGARTFVMEGLIKIAEGFKSIPNIQSPVTYRVCMNRNN